MLGSQVILGAPDGADVVGTDLLERPGVEAPAVDLADEAAVLDAVLASCYIPIAYEAPVVLATPRLGFCVDGCAMNFLPAASLVVSPYHAHQADVAPATEFPK